MNNKYFSDEQAKDAIIEIGRWMHEKNYVVSNDGNISIRVGENRVWITPAGVSKGRMEKNKLVMMDLKGNVLNGGNPSSESNMHLEVYRDSLEAKGVVHAHPPVATAFAVAGIPLELALLPEAVVNLGTVPLAGYAKPGSVDVALSIREYIKSNSAVLLENHGVLTWDDDVYKAYYKLETVEYYANITMITGYVLNKQHVLNGAQIDELVELRKKYGIKTGGRPLSREDMGNSFPFKEMK
jgi:L-fuculose-phosphate aldolase